MKIENNTIIDVKIVGRIGSIYRREGMLHIKDIEIAEKKPLSSNQLKKILEENGYDSKKYRLMITGDIKQMLTMPAEYFFNNATATTYYTTY